MKDHSKCTETRKHTCTWIPSKRTEPRCTRTVVFCCPFSSTVQNLPSAFSCRLSSFWKSAGLQNRKREVRCLQTVPRSGRCVPRPRPNADSEQCKKLWSHPTKGVSTMKRESEIFIIITILKWVRANEKYPETYVSRCYFLVGAGGLREPRC